MDDKPLCSKASSASIKFAEKYDLFCEGERIGYFLKRETKHAYGIKYTTKWQLFREIENHHFCYRKIKSSNGLKPTFMPEFYDGLGQLYETGYPEMTIDGIEEDLCKGGKITSMFVTRGEQQGDLFAESDNDFHIIRSSGTQVINFRSSDSDSDDEGVAEDEVDDMDAQFEPQNETDEGIEAILNSVADSHIAEENTKISAALVKDMADTHGVDTCPQVFMFGTNHQSILSKVLLTGKKSQLCHFVNPFSATTADEYEGFNHSGYGQEISRVHGPSGAVVQKDPADDSEPCGCEHYFEPSEDKTYWKTIRICCPPKPEITATAVTSSAELNPFAMGRKRSGISLEQSPRKITKESEDNTE